MIEKGEDVEVKPGRIIKGDLDLRMLKRDEDGKRLVSSRIKITNSDIQGIVNFEDVIFEENIYFHNSKFNNVSFQGAKFCKDAGFENTVFKGYGEFSHVQFIGDTNFTNVQFIGGADAHFFETKFNGDTFFWSKGDGTTTFGGKAYFGHAKFYKAVTFQGAQFCKKADFQLTHFNGEYVQFMGVHFRDESDFLGARFKGKTLFRKAKFYGLANFQLAHFKEDAYFQDIMFIEGAQANFTETKFDGDAMFVRSLFSENVTFTGARFNKYLDFAYAKFNKDLILDIARIHKMRFRAEFGCNSNISLKDADFDQITNIRWDDIREHLDYEKNGRTTYLSLVKCFKSIGFFDDADDCYYVCRDGMKNENEKSNWSKLYDILSHASCGYGARPGYTLGWILVSMYIFWVIFLGCSRSIFEAIYFSFTSLTGSIPNDLPIGAWKYAVMIESVLGYLFLALFVVVLARKMIR